MARKPPPKLEPAPVDGPFCRDCGARADINFCPVCSQETRIEMPTVGHFVAEFAEQTLALQGQLWRTLYSLLFKPGQLTLDYVAGRRQRYVRPLRLYLAISISFFAVLGITAGDGSFLPDDLLVDDSAKASNAKEGDAQTDKPASAKPAKSKAADKALVVPKTGDPAVDAEARVEAAAAAIEAAAEAKADAAAAGEEARQEAAAAQKAKAEVEKHPPSTDKGDSSPNFSTGYAKLDARLNERFERLKALPRSEITARVVNAFLNYAPFAMFLLLPLFALFLKIGYLRRGANYAIHLLFAVNYHSFIFFMLLIAQLPLISRFDNLLGLIVPAYLLLSLRRVHGGGWLSTTLFTLLISIVYVVAMSVVMVLFTFLPLALL
ncbi:DUF3667 domain-containing protein [uncultured Nevskia sp.]|uniref:DUF3667 domain-containing protein n=1 Tax=uncultured Nevskia sp. TaxID=228950 RepID=UPI0025D4D198|nr:DUF3667 domain-containing protein [uncultured Nevskia sp.]